MVHRYTQNLRLFLFTALFTASTNISLSPSPFLAEHSITLVAFIFFLNFLPSEGEIVSPSSFLKSVFVAETESEIISLCWNYIQSAPERSPHLNYLAT